MSVTIHLRVDDEAVRRAVQDPQLIAGPLKDFLYSSALTVQKEAKLLAPVGVSGGAGLKGSIDTRLEPLRAITFTNKVYAAPVEFGSRPHWPPPGVLDRWVRLKLQQKQIPKKRRSASALALSEISTKSLAFLIARSISRHGTRPHPFMQPGLENSRPRIQEFLRDMALAIERRWKGSA